MAPEFVVGVAPVQPAKKRRINNTLKEGAAIQAVKREAVIKNQISDR